MTTPSGFLYNLFADPDIIRLPKPLAPLQSVIAKFISKRRAPKSRAAYESIGGGSPILKYSNAQADLVADDIGPKFMAVLCIVFFFWGVVKRWQGPVTFERIIFRVRNSKRGTRYLALAGIAMWAALVMYRKWAPAPGA